jgi:hypothetical protein
VHVAGRLPEARELRDGQGFRGAGSDMVGWLRERVELGNEEEKRRAEQILEWAGRPAPRCWHLAFPLGHFLEQQASRPTWAPPDADAKTYAFGGDGDGRSTCGWCRGPLDHLITFDPVPRVEATARKRGVSIAQSAAAHNVA